MNSNVLPLHPVRRHGLWRRKKLLLYHTHSPATAGSSARVLSGHAKGTHSDSWEKWWGHCRKVACDFRKSSGITSGLTDNPVFQRGFSSLCCEITLYAPPKDRSRRIARIKAGKNMHPADGRNNRLMMDNEVGEELSSNY